MCNISRFRFVGEEPQKCTPTRHSSYSYYSYYDYYNYYDYAYYYSYYDYYNDYDYAYDYFILRRVGNNKAEEIPTRVICVFTLQQWSGRYRVPEPIRQADMRSRKVIREWLQEREAEEAARETGGEAGGVETVPSPR